MPRRNRVPVRDVLPDPTYGSKVIAKFINQVMYDGKKGTAQAIVYGAFGIVNNKLGQDPVDVFTKALANATPEVEVKARRVGGATYQVPIEIRADRRQALGLRWLVRYARERNEKTMSDKLANEIIDAINSMGGAFKKKEDTHKMAEANRAFAHYRW